MFKKSLKKIFSRQIDVSEKIQFSIGRSAVRDLKSIQSILDLRDVEASVFSQWGEDGIIEWLIQQNFSIPESFVEFGVENYIESNTRFLLQNRNWSGLVIDGSSANINYIHNDSIYWRHDLAATNSFITVDNINDTIVSSGFKDNIGILSVDIDGNDYWVWEAINCISPAIIIAEYNSVFGDLHAISVPYNPQFIRSTAHFSCLYYGASIRALEYLARRKGYTLLGSNGSGNNAFFVRNDIAHIYTQKILNIKVFPSKFRESRDLNGSLSYQSGLSRSSLIGEMQVVNVESGDISCLNDFNNLYSKEWFSRLCT